MSSSLKNYLSQEDLTRVAQKIAEVERSTSGEIRVCIRHKRGWREGKLSLHDLALREFHRLGMQKTAERTGVLILLLLSERKFEIFGDEGIHARIEEGMWDRVAVAMSAHFREGHFATGIIHAVDVVGNELRKHFPRREDDRNELPNDVVER